MSDELASLDATAQAELVRQRKASPRELKWTERYDTHLAARFRAAGFVFLGRTNVPELGPAPTTEPLAYGPTRNPWDTGRSPGGSSGGSAAAVPPASCRSRTPTTAAA